LKSALFLICLLWLFFPRVASCYDLLIVLSQRSAAYEEVLRGFHASGSFSERQIVVSDYKELDLLRIAREEKPLAIITLGDRALAAARKVRQTPVIAVMALSFRPGGESHPAMTGVEVQAAPERYLPLFAGLKARRIGVISSAGRSTAYLARARKVAANSGVELIVREVKSPREVSGQLATLTGAVDALWMLPDSVTASGEAADAHFYFSATHKVPVVTFSSAYLTSGAAVALDSDRFEMGRQAGAMAARLLDGVSIGAITPETPRRTISKYNPSVLRHIGLTAGGSE
jgi:putative ABC transport system substrate-binding protein